MIQTERRACAESHLIAACRWVRAEPIAVCALPDRVHLLVRFQPADSLADLVGRIQASSEEVLRRARHPVRWSRRFAVATVSPAEVRRLMRQLASHDPGSPGVNGRRF